MSTPANIFVAKDGQEIGPMTAQEFEERHRRQEFKVLDSAWREGMAAWTTVGNLAFILGRERAAGAVVTATPAPGGTPSATVPALSTEMPSGPVSAAYEAMTKARAEELQKKRQALLERVNRVQLLPRLPDTAEARLLSPIALSVGNKGIYSESMTRLVEKHRKLLIERQPLELSGSIPLSSLRRLSISPNMGLTGTALMEAAYYIGVEELKERTAQLGGNALLEVRHTVDCDPPQFQAFCLHFSALAARVPSLNGAEAEAAAAEQTQDSMNALRRTMAAAQGASLPAEAKAALDDLRAQLDKQQEAIRAARDELREREKFLEESEGRLFEKFQEQQVRETELDMREERLAQREKKTTS